MTKIEVNLGGVYEKLSNSAKLKGQRALANQAMADMNQFVPYKEGNLRQATSINTDGSAINYHMKYAAYQYYNQFPPENYTTPGTGGRWDLKAKGMFMNDWVKAFTKGAGW
jgi:hypothetical protein